MASVFWLIYQSLTFPHNWSRQQKCRHCTVTDGYPDTDECNSIFQEPWKLLNQCGATLNINLVTSLVKHKAQIRKSGMKEHVKWKKTEKAKCVSVFTKETRKRGWKTWVVYKLSLSLINEKDFGPNKMQTLISCKNNIHLF